MLCKKCGIDKEESRFEFRNDTKKFRKTCKDCRNKKFNEAYKDNKEKICKRNRETRNRSKEHYNAKSRERYWKNRKELLGKARKRKGYKKIRINSLVKWREKNKDKCSVYQKVIRALKSGKLKKSEKCQMCNKECNTHGHHYDYSKPLDVIWVCSECHRLLHSKYFKEIIN